MAWSNSLNNKFAKIHPKEEEKKQGGSRNDRVCNGKIAF